eukprot:g18885.t1
MFSKMINAATAKSPPPVKDAGDGFEGQHFTRRFSVGPKVVQGAANNVYEAIPKTRKMKAATNPGEETVKKYAVKRVRKWQLREQRKHDLLREVDILRGLAHPNVVAIYQFYQREPTNFYVVLESLPGGELFDRIVKKGSYTEREARDVCKVLVGVVGHLHDRGIVHRDLQPASIRLPRLSEGNNGSIAATPIDTSTTTTTTTTTTDGDITTMITTVVTTITYNNTSCLSLKLTDFGMARSVQTGPVQPERGVNVNGFKAPEILLGKSHSKPVDMWSLGCLTYILLSGKHPFLERDTRKMLLRVAASDYEFKPEDCWGSISGDAKDFIRRLLTVDVERRMTAEQATGHPWLTATAESLEAHNLNKNLKEIKIFNAKRKFQAAVRTFLAGRMFFELPAATAQFSSCYTLGAKLGEGAFGTVFKATRASPNNGSPGRSRSSWVERESAKASSTSVFAVKRIPKRDPRVAAADIEDEVINEANIMRELNHANVVSIYDFFQEDPNYFYMVLELMEGGELFGRIVKKAYYNEAEARDVCKILLGAVSYIHSRGIVHRDLKPENLLLASPNDDTSIRLADFGFASSVREGYLITACGTPGYVAPEMLKNLPYKTSVDVWSVGVIIYVLLAGYPPFYDRDQKRMFRAIRGGHFKFHDKYWKEVSAEAKDLITKLLTVDPEARITASEACEHPWLTTAEPQLSTHNLSAGLEQLKMFNTKRKFRASIQSVIAAKKLADQLGIKDWRTVLRG